jgi:hypothetical protein
MEDAKGTALETELLAATDVAGMIGVKETALLEGRQALAHKAGGS